MIFSGIAQRVRTLALYPRKELLKDQFMETRVNVIELIIRPSTDKDARSVLVLFGDTRSTINAVKDKDKDMPFDLCLAHAEMFGANHWKAEDIKAKRDSSL